MVHTCSVIPLAQASWVVGFVGGKFDYNSRDMMQSSNLNTTLISNFLHATVPHIITVMKGIYIIRYTFMDSSTCVGQDTITVLNLF